MSRSITETNIFNVSDVYDGSNHKHHGSVSAELATPKENIISGLHFRDNILSELWCDRAYKYSTNDFVEQGFVGSNHFANKPWGS